MVMMNAASSGALMGLAMTTHASTPLGSRLSTVQMAKIDRTFDRWKRSITRQGNEGGTEWNGRNDMGGRRAQQGYGPMPPQQGMRQQQGMPQQGYGSMSPQQRMQQQGMQQQGMQQQGIQQQGYGPMASRQGMRQQGDGRMPLQQGVRQQGMRQQGYDSMSPNEGPAATGRRPSSGRLSQAEERAERRAGRVAAQWSGAEWAEESGNFDFPMPQQRRGRVPIYDEDWGSAGPTVARMRSPGSAHQALSAVDSAASMNSFADGSGSMTGEVDRKWLSQQRGYGRMPMQSMQQGYDEMPIQEYGQMPMQQEQEFGQMPMQQGYGQMPVQQGYGQMPVQQGYGQMPMQPGYDQMPMQPYGQMPMQQGLDLPQGFDQMQTSGETCERLSALEGALLGGGSSMQGDPPLQRIAFLEAQLGGASGGTVLERLDQLEHAAQEHGLF